MASMITKKTCGKVEVEMTDKEIILVYNVYVTQLAAEMGDEEAQKTEEATGGARPRPQLENTPRPSRQMETFAKKATKKHAKMELKDKRTYDNVMRSISSNLSPEDKFKVLAEKYKSLYEEVRKLEITQMKYTQLQHENEHLNHEFGKNLLARNRLENLCRELQKQNKEVKCKFDKFNAIIEDNNNKSLKLRDENIDMAAKLQILSEKCHQTEEQMDLMKREMDLEKQLCQSNIAKTKLEVQMEKEQWQQERSALELSLKKSEEIRVQLQVNAKVMQEQIQLYVKKCDEFEKTIRRSNKMFEKCKVEMISMTNKMVAMEQDAKNWKQEWLKRDEEAEGGKKKVTQLEKLCRRMQIERNEYLKLLRANNVDIPTVTIIEAQDLPPTVATEKERELAVLKAKLSELKLDLQDAKDEEGAKDGAPAETKVDAVIQENNSQPPDEASENNSQPPNEASENNGAALVENGGDIKIAEEAPDISGETEAPEEVVPKQGTSREAELGAKE